MVLIRHLSQRPSVLIVAVGFDEHPLMENQLCERGFRFGTEFLITFRSVYAEEPNTNAAVRRLDADGIAVSYARNTTFQDNGTGR